MPIKNTIRKNNQNFINIKIPFSSNDEMFGYEQEVDDLTTDKSNELINPAIDGDVRRFKSEVYHDITFKFYNGSDYESSYDVIGMSDNDLDLRNQNILNSFYILDCYRSNNVMNRVRLFRTYVNNIIRDDHESKITTTDNKEFNNWYVPINLINDNLDNGTFTCYTSLSFYNGVNGMLITFRDNTNNDTPKLYFKTEINVIDKTWKIVDDVNTLHELVSESYDDKINNSISNLDNYRPNTPDGNIFDHTNGTYRTE
ncbi:MAG: hypothetical protein ACOC2W_01500 [bacterium]